MMTKSLFGVAVFTYFAISSVFAAAQPSSPVLGAVGGNGPQGPAGKADGVSGDKGDVTPTRTSTSEAKTSNSISPSLKAQDADDVPSSVGTQYNAADQPNIAATNDNKVEDTQPGDVGSRGPSPGTSLPSSVSNGGESPPTGTTQAPSTTATTSAPADSPPKEAQTTEVDGGHTPSTPTTVTLGPADEPAKHVEGAPEGVSGRGDTIAPTSETSPSTPTVDTTSEAHNPETSASGDAQPFAEDGGGSPKPVAPQLGQDTPEAEALTGQGSLAGETPVSSDLRATHKGRSAQSGRKAGDASDEAKAGQHTKSDGSAATVIQPAPRVDVTTAAKIRNGMNSSFSADYKAVYDGFSASHVFSAVAVVFAVALFY